MAEVDQGTVKDVTITGMEVRGNSQDGSPFHTTAQANDPVMSKALQDKKVSVTYRDMNNGSWSWLINLAPLALLAALWFFMIRQMQTGGNKALIVRQEPGAPALHAAKESHVQGRGRRGRSQRRAERDYRVPA